uniref:Uncharacterized protein n=1 Tax=Anguilla anguilla TaxID=7936 RepID=A0A0E9XAE8_ANGAN
MCNFRRESELFTFKSYKLHERNEEVTKTVLVCISDTVMLF